MCALKPVKKYQIIDSFNDKRENPREIHYLKKNSRHSGMVGVQPLETV
jgi:hypothetical protein